MLFNLNLSSIILLFMQDQSLPETAPVRAMTASPKREQIFSANKKAASPIIKEELRVGLPPWVIPRSQTMCDRCQLIAYKMIALFPALVTFGLYLYLLFFFLLVNLLKLIFQIHVWPSLAGNFDELIGIPNPWSNSLEQETVLFRTNLEIIAFTFNALMLLISIVRTIRTNPG